MNIKYTHGLTDTTGGTRAHRTHTLAGKTVSPEDYDKFRDLRGELSGSMQKAKGKTVEVDGKSEPASFKTVFQDPKHVVKDGKGGWKPDFANEAASDDDDTDDDSYSVVVTAADDADVDDLQDTVDAKADTCDGDVENTDDGEWTVTFDDQASAKRFIRAMQNADGVASAAMESKEAACACKGKCTCGNA